MLATTSCFNNGGDDSGVNTADAAQGDKFGQFTALNPNACVYQTESLIAESWCLPAKKSEIAALLSATAKPGNPNKIGLLLGKIGSPVTESWNVSINEYEGIHAVYLPVASWSYQDASATTPTSGTSPGGNTPGTDSQTAPTGTPAATTSTSPGTGSSAIPSQSDSITYAKAQGFIINSSGFTFDPAQIAKREAAVAIVAEAYSKLVTKKPAPTVTLKPFSDVEADHWSAPYLALAKQLNIVVGVGSGRFGLGMSMTRGNFAIVLDGLAQNLATAPGFKSYPPVSNESSSSKYSDISDTSYESAVDNLYQFCNVPAAILKKDSTTFEGNTPILLGEAVNGLVALVKCAKK